MPFSIAGGVVQGDGYGHIGVANDSVKRNGNSFFLKVMFRLVSAQDDSGLFFALSCCRSKYAGDQPIARDRVA